MKDSNKKKLKIAVNNLREKMELFDLFQQDDEVGIALSDLERKINKKQKDYFKLTIHPNLNIRKVGIGSDTSIEFDIWNGGNRDFIQGNFYGDVFESTYESSEHASRTFNIFYNKIVKAMMNEFSETERRS